MTTQSSKTASKSPVVDAEAIKQAASDYIDGWYEGDAVRMERCLHPDLAKRELSVHPQTGRSMLSPVSTTWMIEYTRAGGGIDTPAGDRDFEVTILDIWKDIASVRVVASGFTDYLHLARFNGEWVVVNALWQRHS